MLATANTHPHRFITVSIDPLAAANRDEIITLRAEMSALKAEVARLRDLVTPPAFEQLVSLNQMAAIVNQKKASLKRYVCDMPPPRTRPHRGQQTMWAWLEVKPWLEVKFSRDLPVRFPTWQSQTDGAGRRLDD